MNEVGRHPGGHDKHAGHSVEMFQRKFWVALALTIPTLIWSDLVQSWLGYTAPAFPGSAYVPALFGAAVYFYGGWVFLQGMVREVRDRLPGMMTLISIAITVAFLYSAGPSGTARARTRHTPQRIDQVRGGAQPT